MPLLHLLRHAKAVRVAATDRDRALAPRGHADAGELAGALAELGIRPGLVLCSTARRTLETWQHLAGFLEPAPVVDLRDELYLADRPTLLGTLRAVGPEVAEAMLIGHNDGLWEFAHSLVGAGDPVLRRALDVGLPTLGLVSLQVDGGWNELGAGRCHLLRYRLPPRP
ncbi:MAG: histidine phosphatase family protein [Alphaproteobacteria bacterium]|nr:histidine phosphatase family protein [Alphaproteobacteria bacterium]TAD86566.1 MAG: histidine phosphatase family protein [Alphaproteobacteria bacterium]